MKHRNAAYPIYPLIDYLKTENGVLREKLGKKRILLTNDQRRCLAIKRKVLSRLGKSLQKGREKINGRQSGGVLSHFVLQAFSEN